MPDSGDLARIAELAGSITPPPRRVLHVGPGVMSALRDTAPPHAPAYSLTRIPIAEDLAIPGTWYLTGEDDEVIAVGIIAPP